MQPTQLLCGRALLAMPALPARCLWQDKVYIPAGGVGAGESSSEGNRILLCSWQSCHTASPRRSMFSVKSTLGRSWGVFREQSPASLLQYSCCHCPLVHTDKAHVRVGSNTFRCAALSPGKPRCSVTSSEPTSTPSSRALVAATAHRSPSCSARSISRRSCSGGSSNPVRAAAVQTIHRSSAPAEGDVNLHDHTLSVHNIGPGSAARSRQGHCSLLCLHAHWSPCRFAAFRC